jgi:hypothetical protein
MTCAAADALSGELTWTDLKLNYWGTNFRITFTATTLTGTTMTSAAVVSNAFIVGGIAKSLELFTPPSGCVASIACTTQPVIKGNVLVACPLCNVPCCEHVYWSKQEKIFFKKKTFLSTLQVPTF